MLKLRPYQQAAVTAVYDYLRDHDDNPVIVIPTGGGKTPVIATICKDAVTRWNGRVLIVAHVRELLEQAVEKLKLVCPELDVGVYSAGLKRRDTDHAVIVAGIQSIYKRACELDAFDLILVDECFVEGTLISTPSGDVPIEQVQPGMFASHALGIDRVIATSARQVDELVTLEFSDGTTITCTPNHPVFTETGWKAAGSLELGSLAIGVEGMRMLWEAVSAVDKSPGRRQSQSSKREALDEAALLLDLLLQDPQQLHPGPRSSREDQPDDESPRALTPGARRQRRTDQTAEESAEEAGRGMGRGALGAGSELPESIAAEEPQDRRGPSGVDDRHRVGWAQPPVASTTAARLTEDNLPGAKRLVRISHHKPAGGRVVFNLHVAGHPSYFANATLVHNCHLIPADGDGMYRTFLADAKLVNPQVRVIGLTATPYRMTSGMICGPEHFLNTVCYEVGVRELIRDGYLCRLVTKAGRTRVDTSDVHVRGGEFVAGEAEELMDQDQLVDAACREIVELTQDRKSVLIFAAGIKHGWHICDVLETKHGVECGFVCGDTPTDRRDELLARFRGDLSDGLFDRKPLKFLCNVNVLTTGFDATNIDCVVLLRPTMSPGLYYQMVGRGFRLHPGKNDCLVLDFGGNILRHGPVDQIRIEDKSNNGGGPAPAKECPNCHSVIAAGYATCPDCGHEFPPPERAKHDAQASGAGILSGEVIDSEYDVQDVRYYVHIKRGAKDDAPRTMRVDYRLGLARHGRFESAEGVSDSGESSPQEERSEQTALGGWQSEWVCFEHTGYPRRKAEVWWKQRSPDPVPDTADEAVMLAEAGALASTERITVRSITGETFDRIIGYKLGPVPEPCSVEATLDVDDVPF